MVVIVSHVSIDETTTKRFNIGCDSYETLTKINEK
jgi:hypothetical protein